MGIVAVTIGFDSIGHEDHHIERRHIASAHGVTVDSLKDRRRKLGKELWKLISGNRSMQQRRGGRRRAGDLNTVVQRTGHQLIVGEHLVPVMDQAGGSGVKAIDTIHLGKM